MSRRSPPGLVALAGPNGAGKSTAGPALLKETLGITEFVNADVIARGISAFAPEKAAFSAGRIMLHRMEELADRRASFAFETTLAGRSHAGWIQKLVEGGYEFHLLFLCFRRRTSPSSAFETGLAWADTPCRKTPSGGATGPAFETSFGFIARLLQTGRSTIIRAGIVRA